MKTSNELMSRDNVRADKPLGLTKVMSFFTSTMTRIFCTELLLLLLLLLLVVVVVVVLLLSSSSPMQMACLKDVSTAKINMQNLRMHESCSN